VALGGSDAEQGHVADVRREAPEAAERCQRIEAETRPLRVVHDCRRQHVRAPEGDAGRGEHRPVGGGGIERDTTVH
jgi:hypothetical protein